MKILALTGVAGSGKTTLSTQLYYEHGWKMTKFAAPIKRMIKELLQYQGVGDVLANRMIDGDLKEMPTQFLNNKTPRYTQQVLGTEWRELIDRNLWVDVWKRSIINYPPNTKIVVDDTRFIHEVNAVRSLGGTIIRILRPNNPTGTAPTHISETEMAEIIPDGTIINDGTPDLMLSKLKLFIGDL